MNGLYGMMLFLFILGASSAMFNEIGIFDQTIPGPDLDVADKTAVTNLHQSSLSASPELGTWTILISFLKVIGGGLLAMFTVIPMILSIGAMMGADAAVMLAVSVFIQVPITIVTLFGLYEFWLGRSVT